MVIMNSILLILALICFASATLSWPTQARLNTTALGLFFWVLHLLVALVPK